MNANKKYIVLIGDIVSSREIPDRDAFQQKLFSVLAGINASNNVNRRSPFTITLGDEFQAVYDRTTDIFLNIITIFRGLYPQRVRFSLGVGAIETRINPEQAIGMDGPAFYLARRGIETIKKSPILIHVNGLGESNASLVNLGLSFVSREMGSWRLGRFMILERLLAGFSVKEIAKEDDVSVQSIYKTIEAGYMNLIIEYFQEISQHINRELDRT